MSAASAHERSSEKDLDFISKMQLTGGGFQPYSDFHQSASKPDAGMAVIGEAKAWCESVLKRVCLREILQPVIKGKQQAFHETDRHF
jgi:hypothetical protein